MTRNEARLAIARSFGAEVINRYEPFHTVVRFRDGLKADDCKAILDAFDPGFTGEIFADNRLLIADPEPAVPLHEGAQ